MTDELLQNEWETTSAVVIAARMVDILRRHQEWESMAVQEAPSFPSTTLEF